MLYSDAQDMKIGLDFDNTLVCYDQLFFDLALEQSSEQKQFPIDLPVSKTAVRDFFRSQNREPEWTALQGLAYGLRILDAQPFDGLVPCLKAWEDRGHELLIVSHKTRRPYAGPAYDLHAAARQWIQTHLLSAGLTFSGGIFLEETRQQKLDRILSLQPTVFIDDLPDILTDLVALGQSKQQSIEGLLFDPHAAVTPEAASSLQRVYQTWSELQSQF